MKLKWKFIMISLFSLSSVMNAAVNVSPNANINSNNVRDNLRDIERTQRLLELRQQQEYINQQLRYPNRNKNLEEKENIPGVEEGKKYLFTDIQLVGSDILKKQTDKVIAGYVNTEMGKSEIYELLTKLSNVYLNAGYSTTLVTLKSGNVNTGQLIYEVKEGKVRNIKFMDKEPTLRDRLKLNMAFPMKNGELLNTKDMDQGIENMNVGGTNNVAEITPTEEYGYSDIVVEENYGTTGVSIGMDDSGYKDKGRNKVNINLSQDNLLGINDTLTLNYIERLTKDRDKDKESNYDIGFSFPIGYWKFSYNFNVGDNYNTVESELGSYRTDSKSEKHRIKLSRVLERGQYHKTTLHLGVEYKDNYNSLNGLVLDVSTKKYANATIAIDHTNKFLGGTIFGMLEYERGVPWFGAEGDPKPYKSGDYKIEYNKINLNIDWLRIFSVREQTFQYRMGIGGSYSDDRLLSAEQFTMGDEYTVRGFKESSVAGNKGIYINNTITYLGTQDMNKYLAMFKPFIGLDGGISRDRDLPKEDKLVGMALGVRFNMGYFNASFTYGIPLIWADGMPHEQNPIYFSMSYSF